MEFLHHPVMQVFHWTCAVAMVGMAIDPTGTLSAGVTNYFGHIGGGLENLFNAATGGEIVAEAGAHAAHGAADTALCGQWLQSASPEIAAQVSEAASLTGMSAADYVCANHLHMH